MKLKKAYMYMSHAHIIHKSSTCHTNLMPSLYGSAVMSLFLDKLLFQTKQAVLDGFSILL